MSDAAFILVILVGCFIGGVSGHLTGRAIGRWLDRHRRGDRVVMSAMDGLPMLAVFDVASQEMVWVQSLAPGQTSVDIPVTHLAERQSDRFDVMVTTDERVARRPTVTAMPDLDGGQRLHIDWTPK